METLAPALPTLWPRMLVGPSIGPAGFLPFAHPDASYFYFARNAVWRSVDLLGLRGGEVLMPAYHHGVEVEALVDAGATVTFYRVGDRWDVDLEDVARRVGPRTRAIYLTHYAGFPGPVKEMRAIADRAGIPLIEDCALSLLSSGPEGTLGQHGDVGIFCLYKTLPVPNGGALTINRADSTAVRAVSGPALVSTLSHVASSLLVSLERAAGPVGGVARRGMRSLAGRTVSAARVERVSTGTQHFSRAHVDWGMSALSRWVAARQDLAAVVELRRRNYFFLLTRLRDRLAPLFQELPAGVCPLFYPLVVEDKPAALAHLRRQGIEAIDFWRHSHPACDLAEFPEVRRLRESVVELPCHQDLDLETMERIVVAVQRLPSLAPAVNRRSVSG